MFDSTEGMVCKWYHLLIILSVILVCSCKSPSEEKPFLTFETIEVSFSAAQQSKTIPFSSNAKKIKAESSKPVWCTVVVLQSQYGSAIEISVLRNTVEGEDRTATITVSAENTEDVYIVVRQASIPPFIDPGNQERLLYWNDPESLIRDQASIAIEEVYKVLSTHPPVTTAGIERRIALFTLDALLHDTRLDNGTAFLTYMEKMAKDVAAELKKDKPTGQEIRFIHFYNCGIIVQTSTVTVAIDLIKGDYAAKPYISESTMRSIVEQCDILFVTHIHADHAEYSVAKMFCEQGKSVIVPEEWWKDLTPRLRAVRGTGMVQETIHLSTKDVSLTVQVYPGFQGDIPNNVYMITLPEGQTIMHTGDQDASTDLDAKVAPVKVDVLLVHCWMIPMERFVSAVQPALVITTHENEMGHTVDHREAYWLTFRRMYEVKVPYIVMAWGESHTVGKPASSFGSFNLLVSI